MNKHDTNVWILNNCFSALYISFCDIFLAYELHRETVIPFLDSLDYEDFKTSIIFLKLDHIE